MRGIEETSMSISEKILAIDIGYRDTKVKTSDKTFSFASSYAPFRSSDIGIGSSYGIATHIGPHTNESLENTVIVGDKAYLYPGSIEPVSNGRLGTDEVLPILGEAILRGNLNGDIVLSTGAPLDLFLREKDSVKRWENKEITVRSTNGRKNSVVIRKIIMYPQGVAASIYLFSSYELPKKPGFIGVVVDIGSKTTDVVTLSLEDREPIRPLCFSIPRGVGDYFNAIADGISKEIGGFRPDRTIIQNCFMDEKFVYEGRTVSMGPIVSAARSAEMGSISNEIRRRIGEKSSLVQLVVAVGGGALPKLLGRMGYSLFQGANVREINETEAKFANALGYYTAAEKRLASPGLRAEEVLS